MKRYGEMTISPTNLAQLLHGVVVADAQGALLDDLDDGSLPEDTYMQSVGITSVFVDRDGMATVEWEMLVISPSEEGA